MLILRTNYNDNNKNGDNNNKIMVKKVFNFKKLQCVFCFMNARKKKFTKIYWIFQESRIQAIPEQKIK